MVNGSSRNWCKINKWMFINDQESKYWNSTLVKETNQKKRLPLENINSWRICRLVCIQLCVQIPFKGLEIFPIGFAVRWAKLDSLSWFLTRFLKALMTDATSNFVSWAARREPKPHLQVLSTTFVPPWLLEDVKHLFLFWPVWLYYLSRKRLADYCCVI